MMSCITNNDYDEFHNKFIAFSNVMFMFILLLCHHVIMFIKVKVITQML